MISPFNTLWWCLQLLTVALCFGLWLIFRKKSEKSKRNFMICLSWITLLYLIFYRLALYFIPNYKYDFWIDLPLHLCNIVVYLAIPAIMMKDSFITRLLRGFCFFVGIVCAPFGLAMPTSGFDKLPLFSVESIGFYGFHGLVIILCVSLCTLNMYRPRYREIPQLVLFLLGLTFIMHILNTILRNSVSPEANFFYTYGIPGNIIMDTLQSWVPINFIWLLPLAPMIGVGWSVITLLFTAPVDIHRYIHSNHKKI